MTSRPTVKPLIRSRSAVLAWTAVLVVALSVATASGSPVCGLTRLNERLTAGSAFPTGTYKVAAGHLIASFTSDGKFSVKSPDGANTIAEGTYTVDGDQITITDAKDGSADEDQRCAEPGKYKWKFDGSALFFTKVEDDCDGRVSALTAGPCPMVKPSK